MKKVPAENYDYAFMLAPWDECIAEYEDIKMQNGFLHLYLQINDKTERLTFTQGSEEANIIKNVLGNCPKGQLIAILRTNLESKPLLIKILRDT